jgi:hypothetical protein
MEKQFAVGKELGRKHFTAILKRGAKWQSRHIPLYIREHLLRPFFITEYNGKEELYIIQMPVVENEKVGFLLFATQARNEEPSKIPNLSQ